MSQILELVFLQVVLHHDEFLFFVVAVVAAEAVIEEVFEEYLKEGDGGETKL